MLSRLASTLAGAGQPHVWFSNGTKLNSSTAKQPMDDPVNPYEAGDSAPEQATRRPGAARLLVPVMSLVTIAVQGYIVIALRPKYAEYFAKSGYELPTSTSVFLQIPTEAWMAGLFVATVLTVLVQWIVRSPKTKLVIHFCMGLMLLAIVVLSFVALRLPIINSLDLLE